MKEEITLTGKWKFVGAELYSGTKWVPTDRYIRGMTWEFLPHFFGKIKTLGTIVEETPTDSPVNMSYAYDPDDSLLKIEIFTECVRGIDDSSEADFYNVSMEDNTTPTIRLSILNEPNCPPPYFRYILRKIYCS